jgi:hypothetical protein
MNSFRSSTHALQDLFALEVCGKGKRWLEIGAYQPEKNSNTALLEKNGWSGVSIEIEEKYREMWNSSWRTKDEFHIADALTFDYEGLNEKFFDYISLDIEPPEFTFKALQRIVDAGIRTKCITFEHDKYSTNDVYQIKAYELLTAQGYLRVIKDVRRLDMHGIYFEDWYVDPALSNFQPTNFLDWASRAYAQYGQHQLRLVP